DLAGYDSLERSDALDRDLGHGEQDDHGDDDPKEDGAVGLGWGRLLEAERVTALAHPVGDRDRRAAADTAMGQLARWVTRWVRGPAHRRAIVLRPARSSVRRHPRSAPA